jgi:hypothetical protein
MHRRTFLVTSAAAAVVGALQLPDCYDCSCGLVTYYRRAEGHYSATHFAGRRFDYRWFRVHEHLHRQMRVSPERAQAYCSKL